MAWRRLVVNSTPTKSLLSPCSLRVLRASVVSFKFYPFAAPAAAPRFAISNSFMKATSASTDARGHAL